MKKWILCAMVLFARAASPQNADNVILSVVTGDGLLPETAFRPLIADRFAMNFTDISGLERPDNVGLVLIEASYSRLVEGQVGADTSCFVINRNPSQNNRALFNTFLLRKKNGLLLSDAIGRRPNVDFRDIITELRRIDRLNPRRR